MPDGRTQYTKTKPIKTEKFVPVLEWFKNRTENSNAWKVSIETIIADNFNLDSKNPNKIKKVDRRNPDEIMINILEQEHRTILLMQDIQKEISRGWNGAR